MIMRGAVRNGLKKRRYSGITDEEQGNKPGDI